MKRRVRYVYREVHKDTFQHEVSAYAKGGWRVHTVTFLGALVHVLFEMEEV